MKHEILSKIVGWCRNVEQKCIIPGNSPSVGVVGVLVDVMTVVLVIKLSVARLIIASYIVLH